MRNLILSLFAFLALGSAALMADDQQGILSCKNPGAQEVPGAHCGVGGPYTYKCGDSWSYTEALSKAKVDAVYQALGELMDFTGKDCLQDCKDPDDGCSMNFTNGVWHDDTNYDINDDKETCTVTVKFCVIKPKVECGPCLVRIE